MASEARPLHILFLPFMAAGHMLPIVDMAKVFSSHGVKTTIVTTAANAPPPHPSFTLHLIPFPSAAVGLPEGCENASTVPSPDLLQNFFKAIYMLHEPFHHVLSSLRPDCVIADRLHTWAVDVASEQYIRCLSFQVTGFFSLCMEKLLDPDYMLQIRTSESDRVTIPGLPHRVELLRSQISDWPGFENSFKLFEEAERKCFGVVVNTFYELEPDYADHYRKVFGMRAWHVGPVSLHIKDKHDRASRGNSTASSSSVDADTCLAWLDSKTPGSVVYVSFGSLTMFTATQLHEIALGLEASGQSFIWVVREDWVVMDGYDERIKAGRKGLIIRGWAPQVLILGHASVGAFVTHCGWNSVMEGVSAGVPLVTWPMFAEQFHNEKIVVEILKMGVSVGVTVNTMRSEERPMVKSKVVERAVREVMDGGEEAEGRRRRAMELKVLAKRAVDEGGSSFLAVEDLIKALHDDILSEIINTGC